MVGIATFRPPNLNLAEVSFALPIETANELIEEVGVVPGPGELETAYRSALNAVWRGGCETVDERIQEGLDLWPAHPTAEELTGDY